MLPKRAPRQTHNCGVNAFYVPWEIATDRTNSNRGIRAPPPESRDTRMFQYVASPLLAVSPDELDALLVRRATETQDENGTLHSQNVPQHARKRELRRFIVTSGIEATEIAAFTYSQARYWGRKFLKWRGVAVDKNPLRCCVVERRTPGRRPSSGKAA